MAGQDASEELICDMCHGLVDPHASYLVKIEVTADPTMPEISREELESLDFRREIERLLDALKDATPRELQDQVHRRFSFRLCPACQRRYLENPLPPG